MPRAQVDGLNIYYETSGEGTPIVFQAHHHRWWQFFQVPFFSRFYKVITFDRRGTGLSDSPSGEWTVTTFAQDLAGLLEDLEIEKAIVAGESTGAWIAQEFGLNYPDKTSALVLGGNGLFNWELKKKWFEEIIKAAEKGMESLQTFDKQPRSFEWETEGPSTVAEEFKESAIGGYILSLLGDILGNDEEAVVKILKASNECDYRKRESELLELDIPSLVIIGANESQRSVELAYEWHKRIPKSEFYIVKDTPHAASLCNPSEWNEVVLSFLRRNGL